MPMYDCDDFEGYTVESDSEVKICPHCGKYYEVVSMFQTPGYRDREQEICPYCGSCNGESMTFEFFTSPLRMYDGDGKEI